MLALALLLQTMAGAAPPPAPPEIVVQGEHPLSGSERVREIDRQITAILPPVSVDQPLARFETTICPGVMGLEPSSAQAVVDRIGIVADTLGLRVGEPGCDPNLLVIVTDDSRAAAKRLATRRAGNFTSQTLADMRRLHGEAGTARGWTETEVLSREGERMTMVVPGDPDNLPIGVPILATRSVSRIALGFRRDIVSSVVMIDAAAARGRDTIQIADYAALRGLAGVRPDTRVPVRSILAAFTPDGDAAAPPGLTDIDWGILRGLYAGRGNRPSGLKRGEMTRAILQAERE